MGRDDGCGSHGTNKNDSGDIRSSDDDETEIKTNATYMNLFCKNREFRFCLFSYTLAQFGKWFTYVASIALIQNVLLQDQETTNPPPSSKIYISILVVVNLLPNVIFSAFSGVLADSQDRRITMILLDLIASIIIPLLYILSYHLQSLPLIYISAFAQATIGALYEPCREAIIPMLVRYDGDYLKLAITTFAIAWSAMASFGSSLGGYAVAYLGVLSCFYIDSITYMTSAIALWNIGGSWKATTPTSDDGKNTSPYHYQSLSDQLQHMFISSIFYLQSSFWGTLVLAKTCGAFTYGAADVLNVAFSEVHSLPGASSSSEEEAESQESKRLGLLFGFMGIGSLGPLVTNVFTNVEDPSSVQLVLIYGFGIITLGYFGMGLFDDPFLSLCLFCSLRSFGSSVVWVNSSLLIQLFSTPDMLGRTVGIDYALATLAEALSATLGGFLLDDCNLTPVQVSFVMGLIGLGTFLVWMLYHNRGGAAALVHDTSSYVVNDQKEQKVEDDSRFHDEKKMSNGVDDDERLYDMEETPLLGRLI